MLTPNVKVVPVLPGWGRIVALFGAGVGMVVVGYVSPMRLVLVALVLVLITVVLVLLSFSEQRLRRSCLEAVAVGTGLTVGLFAAVLVDMYTRGGAMDTVPALAIAEIAGYELVFVTVVPRDSPPRPVVRALVHSPPCRANRQLVLDLCLRPHRQRVRRVP